MKETPNSQQRGSATEDPESGQSGSAGRTDWWHCLCRCSGNRGVSRKSGAWLLDCLHAQSTREIFVSEQRTSQKSKKEAADVFCCVFSFILFSHSLAEIQAAGSLGERWLLRHNQDQETWDWRGGVTQWLLRLLFCLWPIEVILDISP